MIVRLKANEYYQELLYSLSFYINLLNLLNLQGLRGWLLAPGRFQFSSPWSRLLTNSDLKGDACICARVCPIVWSVGRNTIALKWVACFVAIRPLSNELFDLGRSVGRSQSVNRWFDRFVGSIGLDLNPNPDRLMLLVSFLRSFSWAVQDVILF